MGGVLAPSSERRPEQARSHIWNAFQGGSEPAREGGLSGDEDHAPGTKCFCAVPRAIRREM